MLAGVQAGPVETLPVEIEDRTIPGLDGGPLSLRIVRPHDGLARLPGVMYFHGGGWVLGDMHTHDRLTHELANGAHAAVVFVNYTPSPEAHYPVPIEEAYAATTWVADHGQTLNVDPLVWPSWATAWAAIWRGAIVKGARRSTDPFPTALLSGHRRHL